MSQSTYTGSGGDSSAFGNKMVNPDFFLIRFAILFCPQLERKVLKSVKLEQIKPTQVQVI